MSLDSSEFLVFFFFFSSRRRHTRCLSDWSSDVCSSDLYAGLAIVAMGSGLVNPSITGLISLYSGPAEQGRVLGIFRSLGSLSRAITPILAGVVFFIYGSTSVFVAAAVLAAAAIALSRGLPKAAR